MDGINNINTWQQGEYIDKREYTHMPKEWREDRIMEEKLLVREFSTGNAICKTVYPDDAKWIAERLNFASNIQDEIETILIGEGSSLNKIEKLKELLTSHPAN